MDEEEKILEEKCIKYAIANGFRLNPNKKIVRAVIKGLLSNQKSKGELYCPCRVISKNKEKDKEIICPCAFHKKEIEETGHCYCFLYIKGDKS